MSTKAEVIATTLEALDFDIECEHHSHPSGRKGHSGSAWALIHAHPCACGAAGQDFYLCKGSWDHAFTAGLVCGTCDTHKSRFEGWTVIGLVKP